MIALMVAEQVIPYQKLDRPFKAFWDGEEIKAEERERRKGSGLVFAEDYESMVVLFSSPSWFLQ